MKRTIILLINLFLVGYSSFSSFGNTAGSLSSIDSIVVMSTPELYDLSCSWAREYNRQFPEGRISIEKTSFTSLEESVRNGKPGFISGENSALMNAESVMKVVVAHDIIVPVINAKNPLLPDIVSRGVSAENIALLFGQEQVSWGSLIENDNHVPAGVYLLNDQSIDRGLISFLGIKTINGNKTESTQEFVSVVMKDPYAIGFCKLVNVLNTDGSLYEGIRILPIDRNNNGAIDSNEDIYSDMNAFNRGVWIGKYPKALVSNIYSVMPVKAMNEAATAFLKWVLNDGQSVLQTNGYSDLLAYERQTGTDKILEIQAPAADITGTKSVFGTMLIFLAALVIAAFAIDYVIRRVRSGKGKLAGAHSGVKPLIEDSLVFPGGVYFDKTHSWAFMEQNGYIKTGIDDFLQHVTGPISRIQMKNTGDEVKKGEELMSIIQNGKHLTIYSPVTGIIREKNYNLEKDASALNKSPYSDGWVYKIEPLNWARENQLLFMAEKQKQFIKDEMVRFRDFLSTIISGDNVKCAAVIMQDGGAIVDGTLSEMGPEVWEEFQTRFIDKSKQIWFYEII